jgi:hypothetical protein
LIIEERAFLPYNLYTKGGNSGKREKIESRVDIQKQ